MVKLQHREAFAILAKKGVSFKTLIMKADTVGEVKLLKGEYVRVVKLWNVGLLLSLSLRVNDIFN
jgi:hypothetical protein